MPDKQAVYPLSQGYDILVIGGGNAALCAALTARKAGASVLLLENAPRHFRGGNSRHTRNIRYLHQKGDRCLTGSYLEEEFFNDIMQVTGGQTNQKLALLTINQSADAGQWMAQHGCRFQPPLKGTLNLARTNAFFLGGGKALINAYYAKAAQMGVDVLYEAEVRDLEIQDTLFRSASLEVRGTVRTIQAHAVVLASGGFQANLAWLKEYWGSSADHFLIRGTPYNKGRLLRVLLENGARPVGDPRQCHAVAIDARAPQFDGGIVTRLDCVPFGIVVNKYARRFYDEGEDFWPKRYAIWGRLVAEQPDQIAYCIIDSKSLKMFMPSVFPPIEAGSIGELADCLSLDRTVLRETVTTFNQSIRLGRFDGSIKDDCVTEGLVPPKSHWARPIDVPPFYAYPLRPGITFTYFGLTVNEAAQVIFDNDRLAPNIFAAGEIMAGNILGRGYMAGFGMAIGTVFGRIAGREAARYALA